MALDLTTLELAKQFAGLALDSTANDAFLESIIDGVSDLVTIYLDRDFDLAVYQETAFGEDSYSVILNNWPINNIYYSARGLTNVIDVTYDGTTSYPSIIIGDNSEYLRLNYNNITSDIAITIATTVADVVTEINTYVGWTATIAATAYEVYPAQAITEIFRNTLKSNDLFTFEIKMPVSPIHLARQTDNGLYLSNFNIGCSEFIVVLYYAGYEFTTDLPPGLQQVVAQMVADVFKGVSQDRNLKSEKVGDYAYVLNTEVLISTLNAYKASLNLYRNIGV